MEAWDNSSGELGLLPATGELFDGDWPGWMGVLVLVSSKLAGLLSVLVRRRALANRDDAAHFCCSTADGHSCEAASTRDPFTASKATCK